MAKTEDTKADETPKPATIVLDRAYIHQGRVLGPGETSVPADAVDDIRAAIKRAAELDDAVNREKHGIDSREDERRKAAAREAGEPEPEPRAGKKH